MPGSPGGYIACLQGSEVWVGLGEIDSACEQSWDSAATGAEGWAGLQGLQVLSLLVNLEHKSEINSWEGKSGVTQMVTY